MEPLLYAIETLAILAFAYSGAIEARRSGFDYVGVLTVAVVSAFGGGTLRDLLLDRHPLYWIEHWNFLVYIVILSIAEIFLLRLNKDLSGNRAFTLIDALGLGLFCASGVGTALQMNTPLLPASMIGVITATFGGVLRDVLCNRTPHIFLPTEPVYATCAFLGAWTYIMLHSLEFSPLIALSACTLVTFSLRMLAVRFEIRLAL